MWVLPVRDGRTVCIGNLTIDAAVSADGVTVESIGGDALYAALGARLAGGEPLILAPVGADAPSALLEAITAAGTDPQSLPRRPLPTIRNVVTYDTAGGREWHLVHGEAHFEALSVRPGDVQAEVLEAPGILLSGMALQAQLELAAWLRPRTGAGIYFDPQEDYIVGHESDLLGAVGGCDVFLPSQVEAVALARTADLAAACGFLLSQGPHTVVITLADQGCCIATRDDPEPRYLPAEVVRAVDSTGAGDTFAGAFAAEHCRRGDHFAAVSAGAAAARVAVSGPGVSSLLDAVSTRTASGCRESATGVTGFVADAASGRT